MIGNKLFRISRFIEKPTLEKKFFLPNRRWRKGIITHSLSGKIYL